MDTANSRKVSAGTRVYYFDVNTDRKGQRYMSISEIPTDRSPGNKERNRIFIHSEHLDAFIEALRATADEIGEDKCQ